MKFRNRAEDKPSATPAPTSGGKGHPTPKRREAEAKNRRPLVVDDRKQAKAIARQKRDEAYDRQRQAMMTGDERYLPLRDKGPVRRFARAYVDARWNVGELFMPMAVLMIVAMVLVRWIPEVAFYITAGMYLVVFGGIIDAIVMIFLLKRHFATHFDTAEIPKWTGMYAFSRAFMVRPWRMPKPQNRRGEYPMRHNQT